MIIIADGGSTKTLWVAAENGKVTLEVVTEGINPFFQSPEDILNEIQSNAIPFLPQASAVYFYGAGCTPQKSPSMLSILRESFPDASEITVESDLIGAARALCGRNRGIACILGTGSNTCLWDGEKIAQNVPAGGFILGDEGSGAVIGRRFVSDIIKNQLPEELCRKFYTEFDITIADIVERVYRKPFPNRFLAGFTKFIKENIEVTEVRKVVLDSFTDFFKRNISQYDTSYEINIIGSVGYYFEDELRESAEGSGFRLGKIKRSPIDGLVEYHKEKQ